MKDLTDTDFRRAAAMLTHFCDNNGSGVDSLLDEAEQDGRLRELAWCLPAIITGKSETYDPERAVRVFRHLTGVFAAREAQG